MGIEVTNNVDLRKQLQARKDRIERELSVAIQEEAQEIIDQTQKGIGYDGRPFSSYAEYDPKYLEYKVSKGRKGNIDLTFSGRMLNSITTKVEQLGSLLRGIIYVPADQAAKARGNMRTRKFFGLSKEARERITERLRNALKAGS
jgi:phage gpG-like protein